MRQPRADALSEGLVDAAGFLGGALIGWQVGRWLGFDVLAPGEWTARTLVGACRTWGVDSEKRPQRGQFLPDLRAHSPAMGQKSGKKWTAEVVSQPTIPKPDRLLGWLILLAGCGAGKWLSLRWRARRDRARAAKE